MYDAPDNQVVYLPCILHLFHANQTAHYIMPGRIVDLTEIWLFLKGDTHVRIDLLLNLFLTRLAPVVADGFA